MSAPEAGAKAQIQPIAEYDTKGTRLTCLALADGDISVVKLVNGKRKRGDQDDDEDGEAEGVETGDEEPEWGGLENDEGGNGGEDEDEDEEEDENEEEGEEEEEED